MDYRLQGARIEAQLCAPQAGGASSPVLGPPCRGVRPTLDPSTHEAAHPSESLQVCDRRTPLRKPLSLITPVLASALLGSTLLAGAAGAAAAVQVSLNSSAKVPPLLQYGAQADPNRIVRVIVQ